MSRPARADASVAPTGSDGGRRIGGLTCAEVADALPGLLDGPVRGRGRNGRRLTAHVEQCLRCQAELAQYRRLLRSLRTLRDEVVPGTGAHGGPFAAVLDSVAAAGEAHALRAMLTGRRAAYVAGVVTVVAAAAAGAITAFVVTRRPRRR